MVFTPSYTSQALESDIKNRNTPLCDLVIVVKEAAGTTESSRILSLLPLPLPLLLRPTTTDDGTSSTTGWDEEAEKNNFLVEFTLDRGTTRPHRRRNTLKQRLRLRTYRNTKRTHSRQVQMSVIEEKALLIEEKALLIVEKKNRFLTLTTTMATRLLILLPLLM